MRNTVPEPLRGEAMKNKGFAVAFLCALQAAIGQDLHWSAQPVSNEFYNNKNWVNTATGQVLDAGYLNAAGPIQGSLHIANSQVQIGGNQGVRATIALHQGGLKITASSMLMDISQNAGIAMKGGADSLVLAGANLYSSFIHNTKATLRGKSHLYLYGQARTLDGSMVDLQSEDSWIYFIHIKPSKIPEALLAQILINGKPLVLSGNGKNADLYQYNQGAAITATPAAPLTLYRQQNSTGESLDISSKWSYSQELGSWNDAARSFRLKKGWMATFSADDNGGGNSAVYMAVDDDLVVNRLPANLEAQVSSIRLVRWRYVSKKGACFVNRNDLVNALEADWYYEWEIKGWSGTDREFVHMIKGSRPYEWNRSDANWSDVTQQSNPHLLYLNEPESANQGDTPMKKAIDSLPQYLRFGLRTGSPAYTDNGHGWAALDTFVTAAKSRGHRLDFIAVHIYQSSPAANYATKLADLWNRYKLPIWITEWNFGGPWGRNVTQAETHSAIQQIVKVMDGLEYVERHSIFSFVPGSGRALFTSMNPVKLNATGEWYRDHISPSSVGKTVPYYNVIPTVQKPTTRQIRFLSSGGMPAEMNFSLGYLHIGDIGTETIVTIYNLDGKKVHHAQAGSMNDLRFLPSGSYFAALPGRQPFHFVKL